MIAIGWEGFPQYGARCIAELVRNCSEKIIVLATRPSVPIQGMEQLAGCPVVWLSSNDKRSVVELCGEMPRFMSVPGWSSPLFERLRKEVKVSGGVVACGSDNNYMLTFKNVLNAIRFRLFIRHKFDYAFVPGKSGRKLMRFLGMPDKCVVEGCYSADATLFCDGKPLPEREKKIIYVGQFIERKNVRRLVQAFARANVPGWSLDLYGSGILKDELIDLASTFNLQLSTLNSRVGVHDFVQPEQLAGLYQSARLFCLPSLWEHWGLVVHEAALSGCPLLLSKHIGAADDLLVEGKNGWTFDQYCVDDMARVLKRAMESDDAALSAMQTESLQMAKNASLEKFVSGVKKMIA